MESKGSKIYAKDSKKISVTIIPGHFATSHSHINLYIDMTSLKNKHSAAMAVAKSISKEYVYSTNVDTIICMDGCDMIGAYVAEDLTASGMQAINEKDSIYVVSPEFNSDGQMIFRDNIQRMIRDKHVLLLLASATTGKTISRSLDCIEYYGGKVQGISAIFSAVRAIGGHDVQSIFTSEDLPHYNILVRSVPKDNPSRPS